MRLKFLQLFSYSPPEIFAVITAVFFLISAESAICFSNHLIENLQRVSLKKKRVFLLRPLLAVRRSRLISLVEAVDRNLWWRPSCLRRTLALARLSAALGLTPEFKIGVQRPEGSLRAHSWIEVDGIRLEMDDEASSYQALLPAEKNQWRS